MGLHGWRVAGRTRGLGLTWGNRAPFSEAAEEGWKTTAKINEQGRLAVLPRLQKRGRENFPEITRRSLEWSSQALRCDPPVSIPEPSPPHMAQEPVVCAWSFLPPSHCPGEPRVSFRILRTRINQPAPYPEMAVLPGSLHICIFLSFPGFNFLQELILITLFKQRGFGVYTNTTFFSPWNLQNIFLSLFPFQFKGTIALLA